MLSVVQEMNADSEGNQTVGRQWATFNAYDDEGRRILTAQPSAVTGWDEAYDDLLHLQSGNYEFLSDSEGLIERVSWYGETTATDIESGGVEGYYQKTSLRHGELGTPTTQSQVEYVKYSGTVADRYEVARTLSYPTSDGLNPDVTTFSYTWDQQRMESMTVTMPVVEAAQNGPGTAAEMTSWFDLFGRTTWMRDPGGYVQYAGYDPLSGGVTLTIDDIDAATATAYGLSMPAGWSKGDYVGLNLTTQSTVDELGRPTKIVTGTGAEERTDYIIYNDAAREVRYYAGWNGTTATGPTVVMRDDLSGWYSETLTMASAPAVVAGAPTGTEAIADVQSLSRTQVNNAGQPIIQDDYFNLTGVTYSDSKELGTQGVNYLRIEQRYNMQGLPNRTLTPDGTITRIYYDDLRRPVSEWIGTNDEPLTGFWTPDNPAGMIQISAYEYDGGPANVGDSNLTKIILYPQFDQPERVTTYTYDWRNRPVFIKQDDATSSSDETLNRPATYLTYDNLDRVVHSAIYDGDNLILDDLDADGVPDDPFSYDNSILPYFETATEYDSWGRAFRTTDTPWIHSGDYATNPVAGTPSVSQVTYDLRGLPIAVETPNGLTQKTEYDGAGRVTISSLVAAQKGGVGSFHRLFGDGDGSGTVDPSDVIMFGGTFGTSVGDAAYDPAFDFDLSGSIDPSDVVAFGGNFGVSIETGADSPNFIVTGGNSPQQRSRVTGFDLILSGTVTTPGEILVQRRDSTGELTGEITGDYTTTVADGSTTFHVTFDPDNGVFENEMELGSFTQGLWRVTMPGFYMDGKSVESADSTSTALDYVWQETHYTYDSLGQVTQIQTRDRADGAPGTGPLGGAGISARVTNSGYFYDAAGRLTDALDVGTTGGIGWSRPSSVPTRSSTSAVPRLSSYLYGDNGLVAQSMDPNGIISAAEYDLLGRLTQATAAYGSDDAYTTFNHYNSAGQLDRVTLPGSKSGSNTLDRVTEYGYDSWGRMDTVTERVGVFAAERVFSTSYDNLDEPIAVTDPYETTSTTSYDALGRVVAMTEGSNLGAIARPSTMTYDPLGRLLSSTDANSHKTTYAYSEFGGSQVQAKNAANVVTTLRYDLAGNLVSSGVGAHTNKMTYDLLGRMTSSADGVGNTTRYDYFVGTNKNVQTDPLGRATSVQLDSFGLPSIIRDAANRKIATSVYDAGGRLLSVADGNNNLTEYAYDDLNRVTGITEAAGTKLERATSYMYDPDSGDLIRVTDPLGRHSDLVYDAAGRVTKQTAASESITTAPYVVSTEYDKLDRPIFVNQGSRITQYDYDALSQLTKVTPGIGTGLHPETSYAYDAVGNLTTTTDPLGTVSLTKYDAADRPYEFYQAYGTTDQVKTSVTYDNRNFVTSAKDGNGNKTQYFYDNAGRRTQVRNAMTKNTNYQYDPVGRLTSVTDPLNNKTSFSYDVADNLVSVTDPLDHTSSFEYDVVGNRTKATDARSNSTTFTYDALNRLTASKNALDETTSYGYDKADNLTSVTNARSATWTTTYDDLNRPVSVRDPYDHGLDYAYYSDTGDLHTITDALGKTTTMNYDELGRRITVTRPADGVSMATTVTSYDDAGRVIGVTDPMTGYTGMAYDRLGRVTTLTDANGKDTKFTYDAANNRTLVADQLGNKTGYTYDSLNRLTKESDPLGQSILYGYDAADRLTSVTDRLGQKRVFAYDKASQRTSEAWYTAANALVQTQSFTYDENGNLLTATDPDGDYTMTYDALNRAETVVNPSGLGFTFGYDEAGNRKSVVDSDGRETLSAYDLANRLTSRTLEDGATDLRADYAWTIRNDLDSVTRFADQAGTSLVGTSAYAYDDGGRLTSLVQTDADNLTIADYQYVYDLNNRLTEKDDNGTVTSFEYDPTGQLLAENSKTYAYDENGNRTLQTLPTGPNANRISNDGTWAYTYDANGAVTKRTDTTSQLEWRYTYDIRGQMTGAALWDTSTDSQISSVTYQYDAFGNRIGRDDGTTDTTYTLDGWDTAKPAAVGTENFDDYLEESGSDSVVRMFGPGVDQLLGRVDQSGTANWYLPDRQGSVRQVTDSGGGVVATQDYDAFGNVIATTGTMPDGYGYTGRDLDAVTGLQNNRARWYNPETGRWLSEDPLRFAAGDVNLYRYAGNQAPNASDPSGDWLFVPTSNVPELRKILGEDYEYVETDSLYSVIIPKPPLNNNGITRSVIKDRLIQDGFVETWAEAIMNAIYSEDLQNAPGGNGNIIMIYEWHTKNKFSAAYYVRSDELAGMASAAKYPKPTYDLLSYYEWQNQSASCNQHTVTQFTPLLKRGKNNYKWSEDPGAFETEKRLFAYQQQYASQEHMVRKYGILQTWNSLTAYQRVLHVTPLLNIDYFTSGTAKRLTWPGYLAELNKEAENVAPYLIAGAYSLTPTTRGRVGELTQVGGLNTFDLKFADTIFRRQPSIFDGVKRSGFKAPYFRTISEWLPGLADDALIHLTDATPSQLKPGVFANSYWVRYGDVKHLTVPMYKADVVLQHAPAYECGAKFFTIIEKPDLKLFKTSREHGIALEYQNGKIIVPDRIIEIDPLPAYKPPPLTSPPIMDIPFKQKWVRDE